MLQNKTWKVFEGGIHSDQRGELRYNNNLDLSEIKRYYIIGSKRKNSLRAWQGHKIENKYFTLLKGSCKIHLIKIDDWNNPSKDIQITSIDLEESKNKTLFVPGGYATGILNTSEQMELMVFSNQSLTASLDDDFRFDENYWSIPSNN